MARERGSAVAGAAGTAAVAPALLLLLLLHLAATVCQAGAAPALPPDISLWHYGDDNMTKSGVPAQRLWDRGALRLAAPVLHFEQMRGFLAKLRGGQPVQVVAFGTSITADYGGCFGNGGGGEQQRFKQQRDRPFCTNSMSWLAGFMKVGGGNAETIRRAGLFGIGEAFMSTAGLICFDIQT